jgi:hypothetical protein
MREFALCQNLLSGDGTEELLPSSLERNVPTDWSRERIALIHGVDEEMASE